MLHHVSVGVRDVERAARFYDGVLAVLGYRRVMEFLPYGIGYGERTPEFWVQLPADQQPATVGNGTHVGFKARTQAMVDAFHRAAIAAGGTDEGAAGPRPDYGPAYYGAFVRDLDGNKLEAVLTPEPVAAAKPAAKPKPKPKPKRRAATKGTTRRPQKRKSPGKAKRKSPGKAQRKAAKRK